MFAAAAFAAGLTVSGALTFGALGAIGSLLRPGRGFLVAAAVLAGAAVLADLAGLRVRPQLRLQVPERWRQTMPLPRALFLYGLLLGPGIGTYVPATGDGEARAAQVASPGGDPSAEAADLVWQVPGVGGFLLRNGQQTQLPGNDPALGGTRIAWHAGDEVTIADSTTLQPVLQLAIPGVEKLAVSDEWLAYRVRLANGKEELRAFALADPTTTTVLTHARERGYLGRPSLSGDLVVYHLAGPAGSGLFSFDLATGKRRRLRFSTQAQLLSPARLASKLLYVRISRCSQELRLGPLDGNGAGRVLYKLPPLAGEDAGHERGHTHQGEHLPCTPKPKPTARMLWTTALSGTTAYVTVLRPGSGGQTTPTLLALNRS